VDFQDKWIRCVDCGKEFLFTAGEQKFFESKNLYESKRCKTCRDIKKKERAQASAGK